MRVDLADPDEIAPPPGPYDRAKELAILREALEDVRAPGRGTPVEEFMAQLAAEHKLPCVPAESRPMPHALQIFPRAMADIRAAVAWRSQRSPSAAARWHAGLLAAIRSLANNPEHARWPTRRQT